MLERSRAALALVAAALFLLGLPLQPARASLVMAAGAPHMHALLIGVSSYPTLPRKYRLSGPQNDVRVLEQALRARGVADIEILADGVQTSSANPTRLAIFRSLHALRDRVQRGEWVFLYFSGHGSTQPQAAVLSPSTYREPDGLDEIFLPLDVQRWDATTQRVTNAIVDDEIGEEIEALRARGAAVWVVFDTCHAGDMTKGLPAATGIGPERAWRDVPPAVLGVPVAAADSRPAAQMASKGGFPTGSPDHSGMQVFDSRPSAATHQHFPAGPAADKQVMGPPLVAFFATRRDEPAPEESLLPGDGAPHERMVGVFTWYLTRELLGNPLGPRDTFARLAGRIVDHYHADHRVFPNPYLEGPGERDLPF